MLTYNFFCRNQRVVSLNLMERAVLIMLRIGYNSAYLARRIPKVQGGYIHFLPHNYIVIACPLRAGITQSL
jgi:hypothetical protein